jgi:pilus retraction protein PilT
MATVAEAPVDAMPDEPEANKLFRMVMKHKGSDLHLKVGLPPCMRLGGVLRQMSLPPLTSAEMERLMFPLLSPRVRKILEDEGGCDFAHIVYDGKLETRFRVNLFRARGKLSLVARRVSNTIPNFEQLGLPPVIAELCDYEQGIIIFAGVTGSGKTTSIASMLQYINERERMHIVTIEDPIEFTYTDDKSIINQRELGIDVMDFHKSLKDAVRQDPDIILVGEIRDVETAEIAVEAALTGHLLISTLHTNDAPSTIARLTDMDIEPFMISSSILCVCAQRLMRRVCKQCKVQYEPKGREKELLEKGIGWSGLIFKHNPKGCPKCNGSGYRGRVGIHELMVTNEELIEGINKKMETAQLKKIAQRQGMKTLHQDSLLKVKDGLSTMEEAISTVPPDL